MNKAVEILKESRVFYVATTDGDQPRVRPFGAIAEIEGKLYICTSNTKDCFKQMIANPKVEISTMLGAEKWVRICGIIKRDDRLSAREEFLQQTPLATYKADDGIFEVFYLESGVMTTYSFSGKTEVYRL